VIIYITDDFAERLTSELSELNMLKHALQWFEYQVAVLKSDYIDTLNDLEGCLQACSTGAFIHASKIDRHNNCWSLVQLLDKLEYVKKHMQFDREIIEKIIHAEVK
jgi:hypothetical protein